MLLELNAKAVRYTQAGRSGQRFPFHLNDVDRNREKVESHFAEAVVASVFSIKPDKERGQGPYPTAQSIRTIDQDNRSGQSIRTIDQDNQSVHGQSRGENAIF